MADLLILTPNIPQLATRFLSASGFSGSANEQELWPSYNSFRGARWQLWRSGSNATNHYLVYDLGPGQTGSADFLLTSRLDIDKSLATTIALTLAGSADDVSYSTVTTDADIDALTLRGPNSDDYIKTFATSTSYRYWRVLFSGGASFAHNIGKIYFGQAFNLSTELDSYRIERIYASKAPFNSSGGSHLLGRSSEPRYQLELMWRGLTNSEINSFMETIYKKRFTTTFFLYTQTYHDPLNGHRLLQVALDDADSDNEGEKDNYNFLRTKWIQVLG